MSETFTPEAVQLINMLSAAMGGATQKAIREPKVWHPDLGWQPRAKAVGTTPSDRDWETLL